MTNRVYNFYPGPATLPLPALEKAKEEFLDFMGTGMSVIEISHRSAEYDKVHHETMDLVAELMRLPTDYKVLFLQGGASTQFYQVPLNLHVKDKPMEYVNTGRWSEKAIDEARRYGEVSVVASSEDKGFTYIPKDVEFSKDASYAHITSNNTLYGTEWFYTPEVPDGVPLVVDMSSDIMDCVVDFTKYDVIYAGAQKNLGPAGLTVLIVRNELLGRVSDDVPTMTKWSTHAKKDSLYNTPPVFSIYMTKLSLEYLKDIGGVAEQEKRNRKKAGMLYDLIDNSDGFYRGVAEKADRSLMNVTFRLPSEELEDKCAKEGAKRGLIGLKGHRSVGGMRASIYNAMPVEGVETLVEFLNEFQNEHQ